MGFRTSCCRPDIGYLPEYPGSFAGTGSLLLENSPIQPLHHIVIVGGGAGGIELATRLGDELGRRGKARVTLVDRSRTHLWKPLLHEFAAGSMDLDDHALDYLAQARWHHFRFQLGEMDGLDRGRRVVKVARTLDEEGRELIPRREIPYDTLVIAVGSHTNDFGTPGAAEHAISLDRHDQAEIFHRRLINACIRANSQAGPLRPEQLNVAIIGAGATGVELAAELHKTTRELVAYGLDRINQLVVHQTLQTTRDPDVFAIGDCACCPWPQHAPCVPARAQAAHQQATHLVRNLQRRLRGKPLEPYVYRDFGSLVSLGQYSTVGSLMGKLLGGSIFIEGLFARIMYISLYRMHLYALHGLAKVVFDVLGRLFTRRTEPRVKLH